MENTPLQKLSYLVLRVMGSLIFIMAGFNHLFQTQDAVAKLQKAPFGHLTAGLASPETLIILSGVGLLLGGVLLLLGFMTRWTALALALILIPITLTVQVNSPQGSGPLFKNIALLGMLFFFFVNGSRYFSLDQFLQPKLPNKMNLFNTGKLVAFFAIALLPFLSSCATVESATQASSKAATKNYAVLISQPNHVKAAVHTAQTMTPGSSYKRGTFVVMACAKSVEAFVEGSDLASEIEKGRAAGVQYKVCGMSLKQFNIDPATLVEGVTVIPNGLTYMFDLQNQGYTTVEL
ncbi:DoxX family membrane protein [Nibribacter ruber]|uniref:DoxX family membrane protein n=1 Tax=Nibribacter ruber TaxID=2698458 RepID=A0A6P1NV63_9BACT|nr:DoxX family membrane protein [Nibribacter ruber]QHL86940.1 DoxX family membrane protein [Nibribacter ruber]